MNCVDPRHKFIHLPTLVLGPLLCLSSSQVNVLFPVMRVGQ